MSHLSHRKTQYRLRRAASLLLALALTVTTLCTGVFAAAPKSGVTLTAQNGHMLLTNRCDGYRFFVPQDTVLDAKRAEAGISLRAESWSMDVFRQPTTSISASAYISYSKSFLSWNRVDHTEVSQSELEWNGDSVTVTAWRRPPLSRIKDDHPCYTCVDLVHSGCVYTFLLRTDAPLAEDEWQRYLDGLVFFAPTVSAPLVRIGGSTEKKDAATRTLYKKMFGEKADFTWGFYLNRSLNDSTQLHEIEARLNHRFPFIMEYSMVRDAYRSDEVGVPLQNAWSDGKRLVMLTLQTRALADGSSQVYDILDGQYDTFLREYAKAVAKFSHPVLMRLFNEMNGDWCPYSASQYSMDASLYRALYSYIVSFFRSAGADNVLWVWNPNERSFPDFKWNHMALYYPDEGCDLYGITGYNNGTYYEGEVWRSFSEIYDPIFADAAKRCDCPMLITEFSCSDFGGDKAAWIRDMFTHLSDCPMLRAAVWWNGEDFDAAHDMCVAREYRIDHNADYLKLFKNKLSPGPVLQLAQTASELARLARQAR